MTMSEKIFLLEDEENVGSTLKSRLEGAGYQLTWSKSFREGCDTLKSLTLPELPSLALLDVHLPDGDGFQFATQLQKTHPFVPVIFLTAASTPEDRIQGLEIGAEDYVTKPFHFKELLLRIQNVIKRSQFVASLDATKEATLTPIQIGEAEVNFSQYTITYSQHPNLNPTVRLSNKECALLKLLYEKRNTVVSRDEILNLIWSEDEYPTPRTVDNFIVRLRKHLEPNTSESTLIRSVRGVGYCMELKS